MAKGSTDGWKKIAIEQIRKNRLVTSYRGLDTNDIAYKDHPNYKVFETSPNLELDQGQTYLVSGTESQIMLQASLGKYLHDLLGNRLGYTIDFEEWFEDFSLEFKIDPRTGRSRIPVRTEAEIYKFTYWGATKDERPKFEWLDMADNSRRTEKEQEPLGYRVIRFWKNRKNLEDFYVLAGTPTELRSQIFYLMNGGGGGGIVEEYEDKQPTEISTLSNRPHIRLFFRQPADQVARGKQGAKMEVTINIMNKTDISISKSDLVLWATRITEQFNPGGNAYIYQKGKKYYPYHDWGNGYHLQLLSTTETEARQLLLKILAIKQDVLNEKYWKESRAVNEAVAYPNTEETVNIMGETYKKPLRRPVVKVEFRWAKLFLPSIGKQFVLVSNEKRMPVSAEARQN